MGKETVFDGCQRVGENWYNVWTEVHLQLDAGGGPRSLGPLLEEGCMCIVHASNGLSLLSVLLKRNVCITKSRWQTIPYASLLQT